LTLSGPATVKAGSVVSLTLTESGTPAVALQWTVSLPLGYVTTVVPSAAVVAAGKTIFDCAVSICLVAGLNTNLIPNGPIATYSVTLSANAVATPINLSNIIAVDVTGVVISSSPGVAYTYTVLPKQDLNGDGIVNIKDVQLMASEVIAAQTNPSACIDDQNSDGICNIVDVYIIILSALGVI
jgi:hypothetical protein